MKLPFTNSDVRPLGFKAPVASLIRHSTFVISHSRRAPRQGMALVITLIMLSVTLIMAIAFLAISRRERISVSTSTDTTTARLASDTALAAAQGQILANILATNSALYDYNLLVSTNYVNPFGYVIGSQSPTNVNYYYRNVDGLPLNGADFDQNVANLLFLPRPPVMVSATEPLGRFYLDLNRNGGFDTNGVVGNYDNFGNYLGTVFQVGDPEWVGVLERPGVPHAPDNQFLSRYAFIALPIGESLDINAIHNQAFNPALNLNSAQDAFFRNQGVGSWEINLAAFLADLNTNQWDNGTAPYVYNRPLNGSFANTGNAFYDAFTMLAWRYNYNYANLASANALFGPFTGNRAFNVWPFDNIDEYGDGPLQVTTTNISESLPANQDNTALPWPGANNPNRFFTPDDFFDPAKSATGIGGFTNHLQNAGATFLASGVQPNYDRYTFYRMLDELGTDSLPDNAGKLNLNYSNAVVSFDKFGAYLGTTIIPGAETNLVPWIPTNFFCAAADQLLKMYTTNWFQADPSNYLVTYYGLHVQYSYTDPNGNVITESPSGVGLVSALGIPNVLGMIRDGVPAFGLTNIPVVVNGNYVYSAAVNRVLQLAANIYDAGTSSFYPDVFRPTFLVAVLNGYTSVYVNGFTEVASVAGVGDVQLAQPLQWQQLLTGLSTARYPSGVNVYGVPWIIGVKKYLPSFNQFYALDTMQATRKLQFTRQLKDIGKPENLTTSGDYTTNQMIELGLTNSVGFSFWNSYSSNYSVASPNYPYATPNIEIYAGGWSYSMLSNGTVNAYVSSPFQFSTNINIWPGSFWNLKTTPASRTASASSFYSYVTNFTVLPTDSLVFNSAGVFQGYNSPAFNLAISTVPEFPQIVLLTTNLFQGFILDNGHVIDYVHFSQFGAANITADLADPPGPYDLTGKPYMWSTNASKSGISWGVQNQIAVSQTDANLPTGGRWASPGNMPGGLPQSGTPQVEAEFFQAFFTGQSIDGYQNTNVTQQAPYTPVRSATSPVMLFVNDPLVHYFAGDLNEPISGLNGNGVVVSDDPINPKVSPPLLNTFSTRYQPWGVNAQMNAITGVLNDKSYNASYNLAYRDPLVWSSDNWDFPANKYPSVGWLGRVHRGTPWQTVYLKSTNLLEYVDATQLANPNLGLSTWYNWTGDFNALDASDMRPIQDDLLFDVFTAAPDANATLGTLSVNQSGMAAWSAVLGGMNIIANATPGIPSYTPPPLQTNIIINPVGPAGLATLTPLGQIINDINNTRANTAIFPLHAYKRAGDILRVPSLSVASPFLNQSDVKHVDFDISDEMYESIPQQLLGLVRQSSAPRYVVYAWGQTLKPAPDGTVLSGGQFFGLVTNYQVNAESATRAIVTVQQVVTNTVNGPTTNYTTKVESFNVLPPE